MNISKCVQSHTHSLNIIVRENLLCLSLPTHVFCLQRLICLLQLLAILSFGYIQKTGESQILKQKMSTGFRNTDTHPVKGAYSHKGVYSSCRSVLF